MDSYFYDFSNLMSVAFGFVLGGVPFVVRNFFCFCRKVSVLRHALNFCCVEIRKFAFEVSEQEFFAIATVNDCELADLSTLRNIGVLVCTNPELVDSGKAVCYFIGDEFFYAFKYLSLFGKETLLKIGDSEPND